MSLKSFKSLLAQLLPKPLKELIRDWLRESQAQRSNPTATGRDDPARQLSNPAQVSRLGEILVRQRLLSETELRAMLTEQQQTGSKLGELLLKKFLVTEDQLQQALRNQRIRLGELLIEKKLISQELLQDFLASQQKTQQHLGQLLLQADWLSEEQLNSVLQEQYWRRNGYWLID